MNPKRCQNTKIGSWGIPVTPWGSPAGLRGQFWQHFGNVLGSKLMPSEHFLGDFLERFWHTSTLENEHMAMEVLQASHFHPLQFWQVVAFIFVSLFILLLSPCVGQDSFHENVFLCLLCDCHYVPMQFCAETVRIFVALS